MGYWDNVSSLQQRGIDHDLADCLEFNPQDGFSVEDIKRVLAVWEGENDGDDWRWILVLNSGKFVFLQGGCDYTGWDCQSSANSIIVDEIKDIISAIQNPMRFSENTTTVFVHLIKQLISEKDKTWHEKTGKKMGLF